MSVLRARSPLRRTAAGNDYRQTVCILLYSTDDLMRNIFVESFRVHLPFPDTLRLTRLL